MDNEVKKKRDDAKYRKLDCDHQDAGNEQNCLSVQYVVANVVIVFEFTNSSDQRPQMSQR